MSNNNIAPAIYYGIGFNDVSKEIENKAQTICIICPVATAKANSNDINYNTPYHISTVDEAIKLFGICPAYTVLSILKPKSGGGVNGHIVVIPIKEESSTPTAFDLIAIGQNLKDIEYIIKINGKRFLNGQEMRFLIKKDDDLEAIIKAISQAVNSVEYSPVGATTKHLSASGKKTTTNGLTARLPAMLDVESGGFSIVTNNANYPIKINTNGTKTTFTTADLSSNLAGIYAVVNGSFKIASDGAIPTEIPFSNAGGKSTVITTKINANFKNFLQKTGTIRLKQGTKQYDFRITTLGTKAVVALAELNISKVTSLQSVNNGTFDIQTNGMPTALTITVDFTTANSIADILLLINKELQKQNIPARAVKDINSDRLMFETLGANSGASVHITATAPTSGTDVTTSTFFDLANKVELNGLDEIVTTTNQSIVDQLILRMNNELKLNKNTDFSIHKTNDHKELIISGSTDAEELAITSVSGDDLTASGMLDVAEAFKYIATGAIDNPAKLLNYLKLQLKLINSANVEYDVANHKLIFQTKNKGSSSTISFSAGATGTDLTGASLLNTTAGTIVVGKDPKTTIDQIASEIKDQLDTAKAGVDCFADHGELVFINRANTGSISALTIVDLLNFTGTQLTQPKYLDINSMVDNAGHDATNSISLTTKWGGVTSRDVKITIEPQQLGGDVKFILNKSQLGSGTEKINEALESLGDEWVTMLLNAYGMSYRPIFSQWVGSIDKATGRYAEDIFKPAISITGTSESDESALLNFGVGLAEDLSVVIATAPKSQSSDLEIATCYAREISTVYESNPHLTTDGRSLDGVMPPKDGDIGVMKSLGARNRLLLGGISVVTFDKTTEKYVLESTITTRRPKDQNPAAVDFKGVRELVSIDWNIAYKTKLMEQRQIMNKTLVGDKSRANVDNILRASTIKGLFLNFFSVLEQKGIIFSTDLPKKTIEVIQDRQNPKKIIIKFRYIPSFTADIVNNEVEKQFYLGGE